MKLTTDASDAHLVHLFQEELTEFKRELSDVRNAVLTITTDESDSLNVSLKEQEKELFSLSATIKKLLYGASFSTESTTPTTESRGIRLPKIEVATFNGELLNWQTFWEQFDVSVHSRKDISDAEKLTYLRYSLKNGSAKSVIESLSQAGEQYPEAIESLKGRYDKPRLIHQAHVKKIYEVPSSKDGSGKELRRLHDTVQQHLRALKAMGEEPSGAFVTSILELKLDQMTMIEWQKASQDSVGVPHYTKLLEFLDLRAQASETYPSTQEKRVFRNDYRSTHSSSRQIVAHVGNVAESASNCVVCGTEKHPLYACSKLKLFSHDKMLSTVRSNSLCMNCLRPGHISRSCASINRCRRCQKPHHTILHIETKEPSQPPKNDVTFKNGSLPEQSHMANVITSNTQSDSNSAALLMTCQVMVMVLRSEHAVF